MIIDLRQYTPSIYVELEPGIYVFPPMSARGKTYLSDSLYELRSLERVDSVTYISDFRPKEFFDRSKRDLVMLDRYDLYYGQGIDEMNEFARTGIVLVDCKSSFAKLNSRPCLLKMTMDELVVT